MTQPNQGTSPAKKVWKTPEVFLLDTNDIHAKGLNANHEVHVGGHTRLTSNSGADSYLGTPIMYYNALS
ncbi:hypothetical protein ABIB50_000846 [Mucilaginibacter sp. UYCu711]